MFIKERFSQMKDISIVKHPLNPLEFNSKKCASFDSILAPIC